VVTPAWHAYGERRQVKFDRVIVWSVAALVCCSGCVTLTGEEQRELLGRTRDTHARIARLEKSVQQSLSEVNEETQRARADMNESLKTVLDEMQIVRGQVDENTYYVRELAQKLDAVKYSRPEKPYPGVSAPGTGATPPPEPAAVKEEPAAPEPTRSETTQAEAPLLTPANPEEDYRRAKQDYDRGNLELAKLEFEEYLRLYPDSELAPNAQFWLAECYFKSGDLRRSVEEFRKVYTEFPENVKMADAMLNEAYAHLRLEQNEEAVRLLKRVISEHPVSPAAQSAKIKLDALAASGVDISG
jgi:tol-pal system protein YbgF